MSIFSTMLELQLLGLKRILFYPEDQKMFLSGFLCSKEQIRKRSIFWQKPWTNPFAKCRFFRVFRTFFLWSIKHSFLSRISKNLSFFLFLLKKKYEEMVDFSKKNHGLTPLQIVDFVRLCDNFTFKVQKTLFSKQNIKKCFFLPFFLR